MTKNSEAGLQEPPTVQGGGWTHVSNIGDPRQRADYRFFADVRGNYWVCRTGDDPQPHMFNRAEAESLAQALSDTLGLRVMNPPESWGLGPTCDCEAETPDMVVCDGCGKHIDFAEWDQ